MLTEQWIHLNMTKTILYEQALSVSLTPVGFVQFGQFPLHDLSKNGITWY
jgi:hypothetical protein